MVLLLYFLLLFHTHAHLPNNWSFGGIWTHHLQCQDTRSIHWATKDVLFKEEDITKDGLEMHSISTYPLLSWMEHKSTDFSERAHRLSSFNRRLRNHLRWLIIFLGFDTFCIKKAQIDCQIMSEYTPWSLKTQANANNFVNF